MFPLPDSARCSRTVCGALFIATALTLLLAPRNAQAQNQESGLLDRIDHPDRTLAFPLTNKSFGKTAAFKDKQAYTRSYTMGKTATLAGDGAFRTKAYGDSSAYKAKTFAMNDGSYAGKRSFAQTNKLFDTRRVDGRDARDATNTLAGRAFDSHEPFSIQGKRQDTYDEMLKRKKLSIEEVRELLNKNK